MQFVYRHDVQDNQPHMMVLVKTFRRDFTMQQQQQARRELRANLTDLIAWCQETFGPEDDTGRWYTDGEDFWFRDEKDLIVFKMKAS